MKSRRIIESQRPSVRMPNPRTIPHAFELRQTGRALHDSVSVLVLVYASNRTYVGGPIHGDCREPEQRWRAGFPTGLLRAIPIMLGHCFGAYATPGGTALFCFDCIALRVTVSTCGEPSANAELGTWESRPLAWLRPV
jgi:hypothetical protein